MTSADAANSDQIEYWNQQAGKRWVTMQESLDQQLESLGLEAIDRARVSSGERVLDIGCGCGQTTLELARRVGPTGHVRGIDISGPMLARARERGTGVPQIEFTQADAQSCDFDAGTCDLLFSRFGVMFFDDPVAAFANLRRALRADGRLTFLCWRGIEHNPWMRVPIAAVAAEIEFPAPPPPNAPGPFAFADAERVQGILADAGFADVSAEAYTTDVETGGGGTLDEAAEFMLQIGPLARILQEADSDRIASLREIVRGALEPYQGADGIRMGASTWIYKAQNPG